MSHLWREVVLGERIKAEISEEELFKALMKMKRKKPEICWIRQNCC